MNLGTVTLPSEPPGKPQVALVVKNPPANAGDIRGSGLIPGSGRSPGEGNGYPLQYLPREFHGVTKCWISPDVARLSVKPLVAQRKHLFRTRPK